MIVAVCLLLTGALFGIYMFARHLKRRALPKWAAILHGLFGALGFGVVLLMMVRTPGMAFARDAVMILIGAIALGAVNLVFHLRRVRHRTVLIVLHALTAVAGVAMLGYGIASGRDAAATEPTPAPVAAAAKTVVPPATSGDAPEAGAPPVPAAPVPAAPVPAAPPAPAAPAALRVGPAWAESPLIFEGSSATLDARARSTLTDVAKELLAHPEITLVEVQGHADERGDSRLNVQLTVVRAMAAVDVLVSQGVARSRLRGVGYGARCPVDAECQTAAAPTTCHQPAAWQRDRRVSFVILESGSERFGGTVACARGASLTPPARRAP